MVSKLTTFCFAGFGTDRLRRVEAMKTAGRENPIHGVTLPRNRAHGAVGQNKSRSIKWAEKQEKFQLLEKCFFLTSPFIELIRTGGVPRIMSLAVCCPAQQIALVGGHVNNSEKTGSRA